MGKRITKENIPIVISVISLILSIISVSFSAYVGNENLNLSKENYRLTNFIPTIESSFSYSHIQTPSYMRNENFAFFGGQIKIDLMVLASQYSKLVVTLKLLNYSENGAGQLDLEKQSSLGYDEIVYESFVERGFNPIDAYFSFSPSIAVKPNYYSSDTKGFGFQLGNVTLEAKLIDLVTKQAVIAQEFNEGVYIEVKELI